VIKLVVRRKRGRTLSSVGVESCSVPCHSKARSNESIEEPVVKGSKNEVRDFKLILS